MAFNSNFFLSAMNSGVTDFGINTITDAILNPTNAMGDLPHLPFNSIPTYPTLAAPNNINTGVLLNNPNPLVNQSAPENVNQCLARILMLDMIYGTTHGKDAIFEAPKSEAEDNLSIKQESPNLYHVLTGHSPLSTSENEFKPSTKFLLQPQNCSLCQFPIIGGTTAIVEKRPYHVNCVKCTDCEALMGYQDTCFVRDGMILCRSDYMKKLRKTCGKCDAQISTDDVIMKVRDVVFHLNCFTCYICGTALSKGDLYTMSAQSHLFCHAHYPVICNTVLREEAPIVERPNRELSEEPEDFNDEDPQSINNRSKRMRTSFKHHQLRTMKQYFNLNHNPDAKDLKQLAQKTGLTKRVLQVWFQNARAKYRRSVQNRDGISEISPGASQPLSVIDNNSSHMSSSSSHSSDYNPAMASPVDSSVDYYDSTPTLVSL